MPKRLTISIKDKRDLRRRYIRGERAADLVASRRDLGLSLAQIQNLISREGWAKMRGEVEQTRRRAANEVLAQVREETTSDLEKVLRSVNVGLVEDAKQLEDGWDLVEDAAGASSLQRAKSLHLNRLLRLHGLNQESSQAAGGRGDISVVWCPRGTFPDVSAPRTEVEAVNVTGTVVAEGAGPDAGSRLDFEDDEDDDADENTETRP